MADIFGAEKSLHYECKTCDFFTSKKTNYERHIKTKKHLDLHLADKDLHFSKKGANDQNECDCGKQFKHRQSLYKHKKNCKKGIMSIDDFPENMTDKELIMYLLKENQEFKELIMDQTNKMVEQNTKMIENNAKICELASKPSTAIINNNCNNKNQFNLNVFLNEKCKNAMNMSDFISSLEIESNDFEDVGKLGYIQGISNIFIKGLKDLDETVRPMHCSDIKRETLYIKDNDTWDKDHNKQKIRTAIALIAHKNFKYIPIWRDAHPDSYDVTTKKNDLYMQISNQVTTCITPDDEIGINKIIRNVANKVVIDKDGLI
jgi:hypothetical protein